MAKTPGLLVIEAEFATAVTIQPAHQQWRRGYHLFANESSAERIYYQDVRHMRIVISA
jgi:hypothetical protein